MNSVSSECATFNRSVGNDRSGMPTQQTVLEGAATRLARAGVAHPRRNAEWLLADVLACGRAELYAYPTRPVAAGILKRFEQMVARRARREPLQYILGYEEFYGLRLHVTPSVLIPRPETEEVVEEALHCLEAVEAPRVLDVGTGSGCIALALQHQRPDATVYACDISDDALSVAASNAETLHLDVHFFQADVLHASFEEHVPASLDLVISNPPYIPTHEAASLTVDVRDHEPDIALFAGDDPLRFYRAIAAQAQTLLADGGWLVLETHAHYTAEVHVLLREAGFGTVRIENDLAGRTRMAIARRGA